MVKSLIPTAALVAAPVTVSPPTIDFDTAVEEAVAEVSAGSRRYRRLAMSADSSDYCPNCQVIWQRDHDARLQQANYDADEAYGKAPKEEFEELRRTVFEIEAEEWDEDNLTYFENYEFYFDRDKQYDANGEVTLVVSYHGSCRVCGFKHTFKFRDKIPVPGKPLEGAEGPDVYS